MLRYFLILFFSFFSLSAHAEDTLPTKKTDAFALSSEYSLAAQIESASKPKQPESKKKKTVCLNMIVKDETRVIRRCLESVKPVIDYWVIVDTGSTDGTQAMIKDFMKDVPGELQERPWVDFA